MIKSMTAFLTLGYWGDGQQFYITPTGTANMKFTLILKEILSHSVTELRSW